MSSFCHSLLYGFVLIVFQCWHYYCKTHLMLCCCPFSGTCLNSVMYSGNTTLNKFKWKECCYITCIGNAQLLWYLACVVLVMELSACNVCACFDVGYVTTIEAMIPTACLLSGKHVRILMACQIPKQTHSLDYICQSICLKEDDSRAGERWLVHWVFNASLTVAQVT